MLYRVWRPGTYNFELQLATHPAAMSLSIASVEQSALPLYFQLSH